MFHPVIQILILSVPTVSHFGWMFHFLFFRWIGCPLTIFAMRWGKKKRNQEHKNENTQRVETRNNGLPRAIYLQTHFFTNGWILLYVQLRLNFHEPFNPNLGFFVAKLAGDFHRRLQQFEWQFSIGFVKLSACRNWALQIAMEYLPCQKM